MVNIPAMFFQRNLNPLSANPTKWSNTLKPFVGCSLTNFLSVFDHFEGLTPKGLMFQPQCCSVFLWISQSFFRVAFFAEHLQVTASITSKDLRRTYKLQSNKDTKGN